VDTRTRNYYSVSQAALQEQQHDYGGDDEEDKTVQDYDMMAMMAVATALQEQQHDYGGDYGGDYGAQSKQYDPYTLSEQQITAGNSIIYNFSTGIRTVMLVAQMQSGKTGCFLYTAAECIRKGLVERVICLCGATDTELRDQLNKEVRGGGDFYDKYTYHLENYGLNHREIQNIKKKVKDNIKVVWGAKLKKYCTDKSLKTLFIWDESHYAQSKSQAPDKFLEKFGISGSGEGLADSNNYLLSVSATSFSELSCKVNGVQTKRVVAMLPGKGYTSVKNIMESGRLKTFRDVKTALSIALEKPSISPKNCVIRCTKTNMEDIKATCLEKGWKPVLYNSTTKDKEKDEGERIWNGLDNQPQENTAILITGRCRMGKNLVKTHISFVMETCENSNTDTILQGLLGRVCGYYQPGSDTVDVYLPETIVEERNSDGKNELERYVELMDGLNQGKSPEDLNIPTKAMNLDKKSIQKQMKPILPFIVRGVPENAKKEVLESHVKESIMAPDFDYGRTDSQQFESLREMIRLEELVLQTHDVCDNLKGNQEKKWSDLSHKVKVCCITKTDSTPERLWHTDAKGEEGSICHFFYYKDENEYGIPANSVAIYGVTKPINQPNAYPLPLDKCVFNSNHEPYTKADKKDKKAKEAVKEANKKAKEAVKEANKKDKKAKEAVKEANKKDKKAVKEANKKAKEAVKEANKKAKEAVKEANKKAKEAVKEANKKAKEAVKEANKKAKEAKKVVTKFYVNDGLGAAMVDRLLHRKSDDVTDGTLHPRPVNDGQ
jgi:hypothetical protein